MLFAFCFLLFACSRGVKLEQAQAAWDGGDYQGAVEQYERFLKENPHDPKSSLARYQAATIWRRDLREFNRAIEHYIRFIEDFPNAPELSQVRLSLAECYTATKKFREAVSEYETALLLATDDKERRRIRLKIADQYYELKDLGQALAEYGKVVKDVGYDELSELAYLQIGGIRLLRNEYEEAVLPYQFVAQNTKDVQLRRTMRFRLADCYERTFQYDQAVKILEQTEPDPKTPNYIQQRIATIREQQRQRTLSSPAPFGKR